MAEPRAVQNLRLPPTLDIASDAFFDTARRLAFDDTVVIEAVDLARTDAAGLQLLYAVVTAARAAGAQVSWREPSPALRAAAATLGLADLLALPAEES
jgi:anti-anti-sigma regulatory factor